MSKLNDWKGAYEGSFCGAGSVWGAGYMCMVTAKMQQAVHL